MRFKWLGLGRIGAVKDCDEIVGVAGVPSHPIDLRITCGENGYIISACSGKYDERDKVYVAISEEQLCETIVLALVNRKIATR